MNPLQQTPFLAVGFIGLTLVTLLAFYVASGKNRKLILALVIWAATHAGLALSGFYEKSNTLPPRLALAIIPMYAAAIILGLSGYGKSIRNACNLEYLHYLHAVRIPVELVFLHGLFLEGFAAEAVTFHGRNFDIIAGVLGPIVGYLVYRKAILPRGVATAFNVFGIVLLSWTIAQAVLSAPSDYQQFGFDQPTIAVFYFPYTWLPAIVAPLMIWAHFLALGHKGPELKRR